MIKLLKKELRLVMHPTCIIFLGLSAMLLIPNYPYGVTSFYTGLAIFFCCLNGREDGDIHFSATLPIKKRDIVKGRFSLTIFLQLLQILLAVPFMIIRNGFDMPGNEVGMDANIAFLGVMFLIFAVFNISFFPMYFGDVQKVGKPFVISCVTVFLTIGLVEALTHVLPLFRDKLDTADPQFLGYKLAALGIGIAVYALVTLLSYRSSAKSFEALDL